VALAGVLAGLETGVQVRAPMNVHLLINGMPIPVFDQDMAYVVLARDELPDGVDFAIKALQASSTPSF
jgi:hypothetical protein